MGSDWNCGPKMRFSWGWMSWIADLVEWVCDVDRVVHKLQRYKPGISSTLYARHRNLSIHDALFQLTRSISHFIARRGFHSHDDDDFCCAQSVVESSTSSRVAERRRLKLWHAPDLSRTAGHELIQVPSMHIGGDEPCKPLKHFCSCRSLPLLHQGRF